MHSIWTYVLASGVFTKLSMPGAAHNPIGMPTARGSPTTPAGTRTSPAASTQSRPTAPAASNDSSSLPRVRCRPCRGANRDTSCCSTRWSRRTGTSSPLTYVAAPRHSHGYRRRTTSRWPSFRPTTNGWRTISNQSRRDEVYVQPLARDQEGLWQVSTDGGSQPVWSRDGRELFYRRGNTMIAVSVSTSPVFRIGESRPLFEGAFAQRDNAANYDVLPDGKRFIMLQDQDSIGSAQLHVVLNWRREEQRQQ